MRSFRLSKSRIAAGLQCGRRLWLAVHRPQLGDYDADAQRRFSVGDEVGRLARELYGPGILIDGDANLSAAVRETAAALDGGDCTLFESTFRHRDVLVRNDVLRRRNGVCELIEVKSATRLKEYHLQDVAIQAWVTEGAGVRLDTAKVAVIDTGFVYKGDGDYSGVLREIPVADQIRPMMARVPVWVDQLSALLAGPYPAIAPGSQCHKPFDCPFHGFCHGLREDPGSLFTASASERSSGPSTDQSVDLRLGSVDPCIAAFMRGLGYPRFALDFEAAQFAIPRWGGTRPYQQLVFEWSCHREDQRGSLEHREFLDLGSEPPMRAAAEALLAAVGSEGPVLVYGDFEKWRLVEMAAMFPDRAAALEGVTGRLVDVQRLVREAYRHPDLGGALSLKSVVRTVDPALDYAALDEVSDGHSAQSAYHEATACDTPPERRDALAGMLREYCARDSLALLRVAHRLAGIDG